MRLITVLFALGLLVSPAAAQEMTVDGSTQESYERSVKAMVESLPEEDREVFGKGLMNLIITHYPPAQGAEGFQALQFIEPAIEAAHITLDGVSKSEILARGRELAAKSGKKDAEETGPDPKAALRECLQERIILSDVAAEEGRYGHTIHMNVTNNLSWAIAGIRVGYKVLSEGRSVPWEQDDFSLSISGGIEPGETREIRTSLHGIPAIAPKELIATAEVLDVADPQSRQLIRDVRVIGGNWSEEISDLPCE